VFLLPVNSYNSSAFSDDVNDAFCYVSHFYIYNLIEFNDRVWSQNDIDEDYEDEKCCEPMVPTVFRWTGEGQEVYLSGSFDNWSSRIRMVKRLDPFPDVGFIFALTNGFCFSVFTRICFCLLV